MAGRLLLILLLVSVTTSQRLSLRRQASLPNVRPRRQDSGPNLEYVMQVLEQRGLLGKVDPTLLNRVRTVVDQQRQRKQHDVTVVTPSPPPSTPLSILERARARLRGQSSVSRPLPSSRLAKQTPAPRFPHIQTKRNNQVGGACQALKTENRLLKQLLSLKQDSQEDNSISPLTALDVVGQLQAESRTQEQLVLNPNSPTATDEPNFIDLLNQNNNGNELEQQERQIRSILVTPTPTITTAIKTTSYETTVETNITRKIPLLHRGRQIITTIIDPTSEVISTTETLTSTRTVTPSATWSTFTITPTPTTTQPPATRQPLNNLIDSHPHNLLQKLQNNNNNFDRLNTFGGFKAKVVEIPRSLPSIPRQVDSLSNLNLDSLGSGAQLDGLTNQRLDSFNSLQGLLSQLQLSHLNIKQQPALTQLLPLLAQQQQLLPSAVNESPVIETVTAPTVQATESFQTEATATTKTLTLYLSGSKPGEYSTRLTTVVVEPGEEASDKRHRRDVIQPSHVVPILATSLVQSDNTPVDQLDLDSSLSSALVDSDNCKSTVTVTVTETYCHKHP